MLDKKLVSASPNSRLTGLLSSLNRKEWNRLEKFVRSPYHNQHREVTRLFYLLKNAETTHIDRKGIYADLFPGQPYVDGKLRRVFTYLKRLTESFLIWEHLQAHRLERDFSLLHVLTHRKLDKHFESEWKMLDKRLAAAPLRELTYHHQQIQLHLARYNTTRERNERSAETLTELGMQIDVHYVVSKLQQAQRALSFERLLKTAVPVSGMEGVLALVEASQLDRFPAVAVHLSAYQLLRGHQADHHFRLLRTQIREQFALFHPDEVRSLVLIALNYCIAQLNAGREDYLREVFDLYRDTLANRTLFDQGKLSPFTYKNIVSSGLKLKEFEWVAGFIVEYRQFLPTEQADAFFEYNQARLQFARGDFKGVVRQLRGFYSRDLFTDLDARITLIKALYELEEQTEVENQLSNFRQVVRRRELLAYHRQNYLAFRLYLTRLMNLQPMDRTARAELITQVRSEERLVDREWLLEKLEG